MVDWHRNTHPTRDGVDHIPSQPLWIAIIRVVQAIFNVLVLGLAANAASFLYLDGYGMAFFTFIWTVLFLAYIFVTPRFMPHFYFFWGHVAAEILTFIWWLVTFALLANYTRAWEGWWGGFWGGSLVDSTRAATAFAVLNWFLFGVTLGATLFLHHATPVDAAHSNGHTSGGGGGAKFRSFFARNKQTNDLEHNKGPASTTGGNSVELNGQHNVTGNGTYASHGGPQEPPPAASAQHYGEQTRY